jgi:hypothetical protein
MQSISGSLGLAVEAVQQQLLPGRFRPKRPELGDAGRMAVYRRELHRLQRAVMVEAASAVGIMHDIAGVAMSCMHVEGSDCVMHSSAFLCC